MILADTSVWIRFLSRREPYATELKRLLVLDLIAGHDFVHGELLVGDLGGRKKLLAEYEKMPQVPLVPHREVLAFVQARKLNGRDVGWADMHILASAIAKHVRLWTADAPRNHCA